VATATLRDSLSAMSPLLSRRHLLTAGAASAALVSKPGAARAANAGKVVMSVQGGDYAHLLRDIIDQPLRHASGIEVVQDIGDEQARAAKLYIQRNLPRGTVDVSSNSVAVNYKLAQAGVLEPLDAGRIPNLAHVLPQFRDRFIAPQFYSPQVLVYNPTAVSPPPVSFSDLLDPRYHGRVGFPSGSYFNILLAASLLATGSPNEIDRGKPLIMQLNDNGLRLYPSVDSIAPAFASGEIVLGMMGMARVVMWQNEGFRMASAFPREGCIIYESGMVVPRNAPDKSNAFRYLNAMLAPVSQQAFATRMGYTPAVDDAPLTGSIAAQLRMPVPAPKMVAPDYGYASRVQDQASTWWTKLISRR